MSRSERPSGPGFFDQGTKGRCHPPRGERARAASESNTLVVSHWSSPPEPEKIGYVVPVEHLRPTVPAAEWTATLV